MNEDFLYALDIWLDVYGETDLVYDFPDEEWSSVRERETKELRDFCSQGHMVIWLTHEGKECDCSVEITDEPGDSGSRLHCVSGEVIIVSAGEFIQSLLYPELEMEVLLKDLRIVDTKDYLRAVFEQNGQIDDLMPDEKVIDVSYAVKK